MRLSLLNGTGNSTLPIKNGEPHSLCVRRSWSSPRPPQAIVDHRRQHGAVAMLRECIEQEDRLLTKATLVATLPKTQRELERPHACHPQLHGLSPGVCESRRLSINVLARRSIVDFLHIRAVSTRHQRDEIQPVLLRCRCVVLGWVSTAGLG